MAGNSANKTFTVTITPLGGWTQTEWSGGAGQDVWSDPTRYQTGTSIDTSAAGQVRLSAAGGTVFTDSFTRGPADPLPLSPWQTVNGNWTITNGVLSGSGIGSNYGNLYYVPPTQPSDYVLEARVRIPAGSLGGGIGGRLNPATGAHYGIWLYPPDGPATNRGTVALVKFTPNWATYTTVTRTPFTIDANWHDVRVEFVGARIRASVDGDATHRLHGPEPSCRERSLLRHVSSRVDQR